METVTLEYVASFELNGSEYVVFPDSRTMDVYNDATDTDPYREPDRSLVWEVPNGYDVAVQRLVSLGTPL